MMKKLISLLLVAVMCLALVACADTEKIDMLEQEATVLQDKVNSLESVIVDLETKMTELENNIQGESNDDEVEIAEAAILGEWNRKNHEDDKVVFNADHTGYTNYYNDDDNDDDFVWKYDKDLKAYILYIDCYSALGAISLNSDDNGVGYFLLDESEYYKSSQ